MNQEGVQAVVAVPGTEPYEVAAPTPLVAPGIERAVTSGGPVEVIDRSPRIRVPAHRIFKDLDNIGKQTTAYELFFTDTTITPEQIAEKVKVPVLTVCKWIRDGEWMLERAELLAVVTGAEAMEIARDRVARRRTAMTEQADIGKKIRDRVKAELETAESEDGKPLTALGGKTLEGYAKAAQAGTDIEARALGVTKDGETVDQVRGRDRQEAAAGAKGGGKAPLVVIIPGGGLPQVKQVVDVGT